ncbi:MAG: hypothetical protein GX347_03565 [Epulopiscium sp.]|nr:hypothetical protein [Candidatus Epulonipiscium sp.]
MGKYIKYEIKGSYKFILGIITILLVAFSLIQMNIYKLSQQSNAVQNLKVTPFITGISGLVVFGAFLTAFFYIIGSFRKELYENRGYLTFTLPLTGNQIVGAKFIVAMMWFIILGLFVVVYNLLLGSIIFSNDWIANMKDIIQLLREILNQGTIALGVLGILSSIMTLILIYFSITVSRVSIRNKKLGSLWFVLFLILNGVIAYVILKINTIFPYYMDINVFEISHIDNVNLDNVNFVSQTVKNMGSPILLNDNCCNAYINITGLITKILITIGSFLGTGYLIENKIDL